LASISIISVFFTKTKAMATLRNLIERKRLLIFMVVAIVGVLIALILIYSVYMQARPVGSTFSDPSGDAELYVGTEYPGMVDVVGATLQVTGNELKVTISVRDVIPTLDATQNAQYNVTVILQNDVLKAYVISANLTSIGLTGHIVELGETNATVCQTTYDQKSLTMRTTIDELQSTKEINWFVLTTYDKYSGDQLVASGSDIAPKDGYQTTILGS
jgi:hypothetical protein